MIDPMVTMPTELEDELEKHVAAGETAREAMTAINGKLPESERFERLAQLNQPLPADV